MSENDIKLIALFFFFLILDEKLAIDASLNAINLCQKRLKKNPNLSSKTLVVFATYKTWLKFKHKIIRGKTYLTLESGWVTPENVDLSPWKEFQKKCDEVELLPIIWSQLLLIPDDDIAAGLGISHGTIRYRIGNALKHLSQMIKPGTLSPLKSINNG